MFSSCWSPSLPLLHAGQRVLVICKSERKLYGVSGRAPHLARDPLNFLCSSSGCIHPVGDSESDFGWGREVGGTAATQSQKKVVAEGWGGADGGLMPVVTVTLDAEVRVWRVGGDSSLTTVEGGGGWRWVNKVVRQWWRRLGHGRCQRGGRGVLHRGV
jgi:hypothetical protein